ncbi:MAG TPA: hypothetical protein V6D10_00580 [Trichocoleus sp.]
MTGERTESPEGISLQADVEPPSDEAPAEGTWEEDGLATALGTQSSKIAITK